MSDEVILDGKTYISSRRAAELCGYAQDYVGQLARSGRVEARRVAGLWYVEANAIREHQTKAETHVPGPRRDVESRVADTVTGSDGREYVSANRASKLSGYNQDYIGQLARSGQIPAQQFGNRWYVILDPLLSHKREKDALLAAVQTESVGLSKSTTVTREFEDLPATHFAYRQDEAPLLPVIPEAVTVVDSLKAEPEAEGDDTYQIPIRIFRGAPTAPISRRTNRDMTRNNLAMSAAASLGVLAIVIGLFVFTSPPAALSGVLTSRDTLYENLPASNTSISQASAAATSDFRSLLGRRIWATHLEYRRDEARRP